MSDQDDKVTQFTAITGVSEDRAKFYLESAAWQVEVALARYYENDGDVEAAGESQSTPREQDRSPVSQNRPKPKPRSSNIATMNTLTTSSDEEEEGQAYYAGGSENSGQQVLGPPKKRDIVADMFQSVHDHGVEVLDPATSSRSSNRTFPGTGYKLGQDENDTEIIPGAAEPQRPAIVHLRLWRDGFSINDGDLRPYTDPNNAQFLDSIKRGEIPQELRQGNAEVHLAMEDRRMEAYKPQQKKRSTKAFQGQGYTLGSPAPAVVGASKEEDKPVNEAKAKEVLKLDTTKPTTSLQIRLADGSRLVGQFNHDHTIGEVRSFIQNARPQYQAQTFNLLTTYPSKVLDDAETIKTAGLLNAAIMQKLI
ncbi:unnamed protein product [Acanthoscelides obtectus]|uniref:Uncharacterized protein n=1 Tax=Acanthoscelides obtectus TaxID=200917 RepID=A0A9P0PL04_ACAOB|nr:unnamed protein product [Acanthoscelides obtectus]CAK1637578.1 NSFL1 cofactor p47 [Acanthoscelides obtectus]